MISDPVAAGVEDLERPANGVSLEQLGGRAGVPPIAAGPLYQLADGDERGGVAVGDPAEFDVAVHPGVGPFYGPALPGLDGGGTPLACLCHVTDTPGSPQLPGTLSRVRASLDQLGASQSFGKRPGTQLSLAHSFFVSPCRAAVRHHAGRMPLTSGAFLQTAARGRAYRCGPAR